MVSPAGAAQISAKVAHTLYQRYKAGTKILVDFLCDTSISINRKKLKKASRHLRKSGLSPASEVLSSAADTQDGVSRKEFTNEMVEMANEIATSGLQVSYDILKTTRIVIRLRQRCADFYALSVDSNDQKNTSHQAFIVQLRNIFSILTQEQDPELGGWFTTLEEVDLAVLDEEMDAFSLGASQNTGNTATKYRIVIDDEPDIEGIALWSYLQDCIRIQGGIARIWEDTGSLTFEDLTILTNCAMRNIHQPTAI